jgi:hypothetical protein
VNVEEGRDAYAVLTRREQAAECSRRIGSRYARDTGSS